MIGSTTVGLTLVLDLSASLYLGILDSGHGLLASRICPQGTRGETAHDLLDECLVEAGAKHKDLEILCIGTGPGSFTGIRVAVAMVQGLGFAKKLPLFPFSSLAAMEVSVPSKTLALPDNSVSKASIVSAIAASAGQVFARFGSPIQEKLISGQGLMDLAPSHPILVTSGKPPLGETLKASFSQIFRMEDIVHFPFLADLAKTAAPILDGSIRPNYLQASAAEDKRRAQDLGG